MPVKPVANPLDALKGATGISAGPLDQLPELTIAGMPMMPSGGILAGLRGLAGNFTEGASNGLLNGLKSLVGKGEKFFSPQEAQAASASASDLFNPSTARQMNSMYQQARPTVQALEDTGMFGGDRSVGGLRSMGLGEMDPEYTAVGSEGLLNAGRPAPQPGPNAAQSAFAALKSKMNMGVR